MLTDEKRLILKTWIKAILEHAVTRLTMEAQRSWVLNELDKVSKDFGVRLRLTEFLAVDILTLEDADPTMKTVLPPHPVPAPLDRVTEPRYVSPYASFEDEDSLF